MICRVNLFINFLLKTIESQFISEFKSMRNCAKDYKILDYLEIRGKPTDISHSTYH